MAPSLADPVAKQPENGISACLELPQARQIRDMQRLSALFCGLLDDLGQNIRFTSQSANKETRIETTDFILRLSMSDRALCLWLDPVENAGETGVRKVEAMLARLVRAACPVLQPTSIRWRDHVRLVDSGTWLAAFRPVWPRRVQRKIRAPETRRLSGPGVAVWPDRPSDLPPTDLRVASNATKAAMSARYAQWQPGADAAAPENRFRPEPFTWRLSSWTLTGATAVLCPPAGASMAVLNLTKRANLRLNLHALTLTLVIVSLHQSGALDGAIRTPGF